MSSIVQNAGTRGNDSPVMRLRVVAALVVLLLLLGQACSDDGGGTVAPELCIEYVPAAPPVAGTVASRLSADSTCGLVALEMVVTDVDGVFAFESVVTFDPNTVAYLGFSTADSVLSSDGTDINVNVSQLVAGTLTLGVSRVGATAIDVVGSQVLIALNFGFLGFEETSVLQVQTPCLLDNATPPQPIGNVVCSGGDIFLR